MSERQAGPGKWRDLWPLIVALLVLAVPVAMGAWNSVRAGEGKFLYMLDDAYIHMAVAKNFVVHGVWGITRYGFSSSTSSLLWPLLLAAVTAVAGDHALVPLVLNVVFAVATVILVYWMLRRFRLPSLAIAVSLVSVVLLTPLPILILGGMEHVLHVFVTLAFAYVAARTLMLDAALSTTRTALLILLAVCAVATRYESLAGVAVVTLLLMCRRRYALAVMLASLAAAPVIAFGVLSVRRGWAFLPNPILLKATGLNFGTLGGLARTLGLQSLERILETPHVLTLLLAVLILYVGRRDDRHGWWEDSTLMLLIFVTSTVAHMQFGGVGWLFRYEAYLIALGMVVVAVNLPRLDWIMTGSPRWSWSKAAAIACLAGLLAAPILIRGLKATRDSAAGSGYFYHTTYQMSRFIDTWDRGQSIAINDIGVVNYFADCRCVDLVGLGTFDPARRPKNESHRAMVDRVTRAYGVKLAILSIWFPAKNAHLIPDHWRWIGKWVFRGDEIWFYAADERWEADAREHFERFTPKLPREVNATTVRTVNSNRGAGIVTKN